MIHHTPKSDLIIYDKFIETYKFEDNNLLNLKVLELMNILPKGLVGDIDIFFNFLCSFELPRKNILLLLENWLYLNLVFKDINVKFHSYYSGQAKIDLVLYREHKEVKKYLSLINEFLVHHSIKTQDFLIYAEVRFFMVCKKTIKTLSLKKNRIAVIHVMHMLKHHKNKFMNNYINIKKTSSKKKINSSAFKPYFINKI